MYIPSSTWSWAFVGVTLVQGVVVLAFEAYVFYLFQTSLYNIRIPDESAEETIPTFLTLYIFGVIYEMFLVYDALRLKNTIQVIGLCIYNYALLIYAGIQMTQINDAQHLLASLKDIKLTTWAAVKPFLIAIPCVIAIGSLAMSFVARKLYDEFAWTIYKHISADVKMKRRYLTYQIYIALLKFDFFFFIGFTIQFLVIVVSKTNVEFGLTIAAIPVTIIILIMGGVFTRRENRPGMAMIIFLYLAGFAYFLFKLVRMYQRTDTGELTNRAKAYLPIRKSLTTFAVLTIIAILLTITNAVMCTLNFGQGLKPYIVDRKLESDEEKTNATMEMPVLSHGGMGNMPSRMTID